MKGGRGGISAAADSVTSKQRKKPGGGEPPGLPTKGDCLPIGDRPGGGSAGEEFTTRQTRSLCCFAHFSGWAVK